ncbi:MAG: HU family DNA-binding protein [Bacteroidales bacterium]|nr:HU family DNA-binding protein [Bacteroidales bacterium]MCL2133244.1 HU family DNA-binding protein [Bacteroidales bacterium]
MVELSVISKLLHQLLGSYNRVSLPGLGAFKVEYTPAAFISGGKGMTPPFKHVDFSSAEIWNDNLLEDALAKELDCSLEDAKQQLAAFVEQIEQALAKKQRITFSGVGVLRLTDDEEYRFESEKNEHLNAASYGLIEIDMTPPPSIEEEPQQIEQITPPPVFIEPIVVAPVIVETPKAPEIEEPRPPRSYKWLRILVIIVVLAICGYIFRKPIQAIVERAYYGKYYNTFVKEYKY